MVKEVFNLSSLRNLEAVVRRCSVKKNVLGSFANSQENTCARVSFLIKKETLALVFSCEFYEISSKLVEIMMVNIVYKAL